MVIALVAALVVGYIAYHQLHDNLLWGGVGAVATFLIVKGLT